MKSNFNKTPKLPKMILYIFVVIVFLSGCKTNMNMIMGKTYYYEDTSIALTAGFDKDTLYYIMKDVRRPFFHRTKYKAEKLNDSMFRIVVTDKPSFWTQNTWDIKVINGDGFYSAESGRYYRLYADSMLIKLGFQ